MRLRASNILGIEALIEIDRGIDATHDLRRAAGKTAAPQRILFCGGHGQPLRAPRSEMIMKCTVVAALLFLLVAPGGSSAAECDAGAAEHTKLGEFVPASEPAPAPAISLADPSGVTVDLSDLRGKLVLINLWATWCEPCLREMPSLERLQSRLGDKIVVVAISEDRGGSKTVEPFIGKLGLKSVKIYLDPKSAMERAFKVQGLPTSFLIDREGRVLGRVEGAAEWDKPKLLGILKSFLGDEEIIKASLHKARP